MPGLLLLATLQSAQAVPPRVLMLGNSYTQFNDLQMRVAEVTASTVPGLADAEGVRRTSGGLRLPDHVERAEGGDERWVDALTGEPGRWRWIVLQDQSQVPGFPESESYWIDSAEAVPVLDGYAVAQDAETVLFMTWGRRDGDTHNPSMFPDFETMNARLDSGYRAYAERPSVDGRTLWIAPAGRAFGEVYDRLEAAGVTPEDDGTDFHRLYEGDGSHPSPLGSALTAGVFVRTLTGWTPHWSAPPPGVDEADLGWLAEVSEAAVEPFDDLPYPWAHALADWSAPADLTAIDGARVVSEVDACPTLQVTGVEAGEARWHLGGAHEGVPGCGRLWIDAGAELSTTQLSLAEDAGARGEVVVVDGALAAGVTVLGSDAGIGEVLVRGGSADLGRVQATSGRIRVSGGSLSVDGDSSGGGLQMTGGSLHLAVGETGWSLSEAASLAGTLSVELLAEASVDVLEAPSVTLADDLVVTLPDGWSWALVDTDAGQAMRVSPDDAGGDSGGGDGEGDGAGEDGSDDAGNDTADAATLGASPDGDDKAGCGCAAASSASGMVGLGAGLLAVARRRRLR